MTRPPALNLNNPTPTRLAKRLAKRLLYSDPSRLAKVRDNGMRADFSWFRTTTEYDRLYNTIRP